MGYWNYLVFQWLMSTLKKNWLALYQIDERRLKILLEPCTEWGIRRRVELPGGKLERPLCMIWGNQRS